MQKEVLVLEARAGAVRVSPFLFVILTLHEICWFYLLTGVVVMRPNDQGAACGSLRRRRFGDVKAWENGERRVTWCALTRNSRCDEECARFGKAGGMWVYCS